MTSFKYAAKKSTGQTVEGMIQADDRGQAVAELRRQNLVVLRLDAAAASAAPRAPRFAFLTRSPRVTNEELVLFTRQLSTMVGAGLALLESIDVLGEQAETPGTELPALTQFTLDTSEWLKNNWYVVVGAAFGAFAATTLFKQTPRGALFFDHVALRAPIFGPIARKVALARFSRTFATLIRSGVPIMGTLDIVADTAGNRVIAEVDSNPRSAAFWTRSPTNC